MTHPAAGWLYRWREPLVWGALAAAGLGLAVQALQPFAPVLLGFGGLVAFAGLALLVSALQRRAFRVETPGEGIVEIDEGRISYFGPRTGGVVELTSIVRVEIATRPHVLPDSAHAWVLTDEDGNRLVIPLGALGAEGLPDALSPLPGLQLGPGVAALAHNRPGATLLWERPRPSLRRAAGD